LLRETEASRIVSHLRAFSLAELPRLDHRIFELARSDDDTLLTELEKADVEIAVIGIPEAAEMTEALAQVRSAASNQQFAATELVRGTRP